MKYNVSVYPVQRFSQLLIKTCYSIHALNLILNYVSGHRKVNL